MTSQLADPNCPNCHGSGYTRSDPESWAPIDFATCHCVLRRERILNIARRLQQADLPGVYADAEIDDLNEREGTALVEDKDRKREMPKAQAEIDRENKVKLHRLAAEPLPPGQIVIFTGPPGAGKTYGAAALLREQIRRYGKTGFYITSWNYINQLLPDRATPEEQRRLRRLVARVDILMLDDLGIEKSSSSTMRELWHLIDERTKNGLATIVTSNLMMAEIFGQTAAQRAAITDFSADVREAFDIGRRIFSRFKEERYLIEWPETMTDWRGESFKRKEARRTTLSSTRTDRARRPDLVDDEEEAS